MRNAVGVAHMFAVSVGDVQLVGLVMCRLDVVNGGYELSIV